MKRIAGILTLLIPLSLISIEPAFSDFSLQNCLSIRNIAATVDGTKITVKADVYQSCGEFTSPNFDGYSPRYSISNLGLFCSGPALRTGRQTFLPVSLGSISCSGTSEKYGTTQSTLTASLGYLNFNVNEVANRFSHAEIERISQRADCIELRSPSSSQSSTLITLKFDVYATCSSGQLGSSLGRNPLYQMTQEESLFNLNSCSGPSVSPLIGSGWLGTATCLLRVGSNTLPSSRTGATSTTIEVKFVWDFSSKTISVSHSAIPAGTNNGWGGTSSGSTGGNGSSSQVVPTPNCSTAPDTPIVSYEYDNRGINFKVTPVSTGGKASRINWTYTVFDVASQKWGEWFPFTAVSPAIEFVKSFPTDPTKKYIGFDVYASNDCGSSKLVWEIKDKIVLELTSTQVDEISPAQNPIAKIRAGQSGSLSSLANSKLKLKLAARSTSTSVCEVASDHLIKFISAGECTLVFSSITDGIKTAAPPKNISLKIYPSKADQTIPDPNLKESYSLSETNFALNLKSSAGLPVSFESATEFSCSVIGDRVVFHDVGNCMIFASQAGDEDTNIAFSKDFTFWIVENPKKKTTITCTKGKLTKKVTAVNPKCPAGYKKN